MQRNKTQAQGMAGGSGMQGTPQNNMREAMMHLLRNSQITTAGWQSTSRPEERLPLLQQLATSIQLAMPGNEPRNTQHIQKILGMASGIEATAFRQAPDRESYHKAVASKQQEIQNSRQRNVQNAQFGSQGPTGIQQGVNNLPMNMPHTNMPIGNMQQGNMQQANMQQGNMQQDNMQQGNMQQASMQQGNMQQANMQQTNMQQPNLQQANVQQTNMQGGNIQQNAMGLNQPHFTQGFPQQLQQQMLQQQAQQQQMRAQGIMGPNRNPLQQNMGNMNVTPANMQQFQQMQQTNMQPVNPQLSLGQGQTQFTPEEQQRIGAVAQLLFKQAIDDGTIESAREAVAKLPPERRLQIQNAGVDPLQAHFRRRAASQYIFQKKQFIQNQRPGSNAQATNPMQSMPVNDNGVRNGTFNPNFDLSQFTGLQEQAMRSQDLGDVVVPASNNPSLAGPRAGLGPRVGLAGADVPQVGQTPNAAGQQQPNQQTHQSQQQIQQQQQPQQAQPQPSKGPGGQAQRKGAKAQQTTQSQPAPTPNPSQTQAQARARAQAQIRQNQQGQQNQPQKTPSQNQLQGQGLHSSQQQEPQPSPAMPMLNQPLPSTMDQLNKTPQQLTRQPNAHPNQIAQIATGSQMQMTHNQGQHPGQAQQNIHSYIQNLPPELQHIFQGLSNELKNRLASTDPERIFQFLERVKEQNARQGLSNFNQAQGAAGRVPPVSGVSQAQAINTSMSMPNLQDFDALRNRQQIMPPNPLAVPSGISQQQSQPVPSQADLRLPQFDERLADSMPLPRQQLAQSFPNIAFPQQLGTWSDLKNWLRQSPSSLTQQNRAKLQGIQTSQMANRRQQLQQQTPANNAMLAPHAANVSAGPNQIEDPNQRPAVRAGLVRYTEGLPHLCTFSDEDLKKFREKVPGAANRPDEELRKFLLRDRFEKLQNNDPQLAQEVVRAQQLIKKRQEHMQMLSQGQQNVIGANPQFQNQPSQAGSILQQQLSNVPLPHNGQFQQPPSRPMPPAMNPNVSMPQAMGIDSQPGSQFIPTPTGQMPQMVNGLPNMPLEQWNRMSQEQRQQEIQRRIQSGMFNMGPQQMTPQNQQNTHNAAMLNNNNQALQMQFDRMTQHIHQNTPPGQVLQHMSPAEKQRIQNEFRGLDQFLPYAEGLLRLYFCDSAQRDRVHVVAGDMIRCIYQLRQQNPKANEYTLDLPTIQGICLRIKKFVDAVARMAQNKGFKLPGPPPPTFGPNQTQAQQQPIATAASPPAVNQSGKPKAQEAKAPSMAKSQSAQKSKNSKTPAAPTTSTPPFTIGAASPHGTPVYGPTTFKADTLNINPKKKRKLDGKQNDNATATSSAQVGHAAQHQKHIGPSPDRLATSDQKSPHQHMEQVSPSTKSLEYKCPIPYCDSELTGFESQAQADVHAKEKHGYVGDALEWCLDNMRKAFSLDDQAELEKSKEKQSHAPPVSSATSSISKDRPKDRDYLALKKESSTPSSLLGIRPSIKQGINSSTSSITKASTPAPVISSMQKTDSQSKLPASTLSISNQTSVLERVDGFKDPWKLAKISLESLNFVFTGLDGFRTVLSTCPSPSALQPSAWSAAGTSEMKDEDLLMSTPEDSDQSPSSLVRLSLEDWNPFPDLTESTVAEWDQTDFVSQVGKNADNGIASWGVGQPNEKQALSLGWPHAQIEDKDTNRLSEEQNAEEERIDFDWENIDWAQMKKDAQSLSVGL